MDNEQLNEGPGFGEDQDYSEAEAIISQAEAEQSTESGQDLGQNQPGEYIAVDDPIRSAKGLVRAVLKGANWLLSFKEPRIQWGEEIIQGAEEDIAPALVKHGVGSGGVSKYGEEAAALGCLAKLGWQTRVAIVELRQHDEAQAKKAKEGVSGGEES